MLCDYMCQDDLIANDGECIHADKFAFSVLEEVFADDRVDCAEFYILELSNDGELFTIGSVTWDRINYSRLDVVCQIEHRYSS